MNAWVLRFYSLVMRLAQPFLRRKLARRAKLEPGYGVAVEERFGFYAQPAEKSPELVWVHAVSLGETRTAAILIQAMRSQIPGLRVLLTHGTATGRAEGAGLLQPGDVQVWQPWDTPAGVARFFDHFKPRLGLLMETEVWPCTVAEAKARGLPLVLVNARLSEKSLQQALRISALSYPAFAALGAVYAQTADDARRFRQLGVDVAGVFGNLKFDATPSHSQQILGKQWRGGLQQPVVMFASSREGEEIEFFRCIGNVVQQVRLPSAINSIAIDATPSISLAARTLLVPRHPQRFDEVAALAEQHGLTVSRRSSWPAAGPAGDALAMAADVWLGDSLGEMALYYAMSDVALLGGSFAPLGGQNLIEAASCGCPVVMGPHTFNFAEAASQAEAGGAASRVAGMPEGVQLALQIAADSPRHAATVAASLAFAGANRGATARTLDALQPFLLPAL